MWRLGGHPIALVLTVFGVLWAVDGPALGLANIISVLLVDIGIHLLVGAVFDDRVTMLVALLIVVVISAPLRDRLFRAASRLVNGTRDDPYAVVSEPRGSCASSSTDPAAPSSTPRSAPPPRTRSRCPARGRRDRTDQDASCRAAAVAPGCAFVRTVARAATR